MEQAQEKRLTEDYNRITHGVIWKELILYVLPLIFGTFFQQLYNTVDAVVVGRFVGKEALSAVGGTSGIVVNIFVGFFVGVSSGAGVVVAQQFGAGNEKNVSDAVHTSIAISILSGIVLTIVGLLIARPISVLMQTPADVLPGTVTYLSVYFIGMVPNLIYNMGSGILRATGDSKNPLYFLIITCILNIILDLLFVLVLHMGVLGVAIATILCQLVSAALVIFTLLRVKNACRLRPEKLRVNRKQLSRILAIGLPAGVQSLMYTLSNMIIQTAINSFGTDPVAAWTAYGKLDSLYWMLVWRCNHDLRWTELWCKTVSACTVLYPPMLPHRHTNDTCDGLVLLCVWRHLPTAFYRGSGGAPDWNGDHPFHGAFFHYVYSNRGSFRFASANRPNSISLVLFSSSSSPKCIILRLRYS